MTLADVVDEFADTVADALSPPGESANGGILARLCSEPSRIGSDDDQILGTLVAFTRVLNLTTTALAAVTEAAEQAGTRRRKRLRSSTDLLKHLGGAPALAHRLARVGADAPAMPSVMIRSRAGAVPIEHADAIARSIRFVAKRVTLDNARQSDLVRRLSAQATPKDVERRARELALAWAPDEDAGDPERVPVAENPALNKMALTVGADGRTEVSMDLDALTAEELCQALDALSKPITQPDGSSDPRTVEQRRSDAHAQVIRDYLARRDRPTSPCGVLPPRDADRADPARSR